MVHAPAGSGMVVLCPCSPMSGWHACMACCGSTSLPTEWHAGLTCLAAWSRRHACALYKHLLVHHRCKHANPAHAPCTAWSLAAWPQNADQKRQAFSKRKRGLVLKSYQLYKLTDAKVL